MDKAEWDALDTEHREVTVAQTVMGFVVCDREKAVQLSNENKPTDPRLLATWSPWDNFYTEGFYVVENPPSCSGLARVENYTTDRNACALVLNEIKGREVLTNKMFVQHLLSFQVGTRSPWSTVSILLSDPDTVCYCAVKVVADVTEV